LKSYAENFDVYGYNLPLLNRTKLFIHALQCNTDISWDTKLSAKLQKEWHLICNQIKSTNVVNIERFVGTRQDKYELVIFTDSSKDLYGVVLYLINLKTMRSSYLLSKNRVVGKNLEGKSIPSLELCAVLLGVETLLKTRDEISNTDLLNAINVVNLVLYTDSMIALNWLDGITNKLSKSQNKLSVFVRNRLFKIQNLCNDKAVTFKFIAGVENPADQVTRAVSFKQLHKTNFYSGPEFLICPEIIPNVLSVTIPSPNFVVNNIVIEKVTSYDKTCIMLTPSNFSSFSKLVNVHSYVLKFVHKLKVKIGKSDCVRNINFFTQSRVNVIKEDQQKNFADCFDYFAQRNTNVKSMPNIIKQLNVFLDNSGILRVRSKFENKLVNGCPYQPILLSKHSILAPLIINSLHCRMGHAGKYVILTELRKEFYIPSCFSKVKSVLGKCTLCKRFNAKPVSLNQSPYRSERVLP
jgi:hypothetical protein